MEYLSLFNKKRNLIFILILIVGVGLIIIDKNNEPLINDINEMTSSGQVDISPEEYNEQIELISLLSISASI